MRKRLDAKSIVQLIQSLDIPSGKKMMFHNVVLFLCFFFFWLRSNLCYTMQEVRRI